MSLTPTRFLLVVFQIERICCKTCPGEMLQASSTMPSDPDSIYEQTMDQINSQSDKSQIQLANRVLSYLVLAKRNLSVNELIEALAIQPGIGEIDSLWKRRSETLSEVCRGLVVIDDNSCIIRLAHLTLQDYLTRKLPDIYEMKKEICLACITYLSFDAFKEGPCRNRRSLADRTRTHQFLYYAAHQLSAHLHELNEGAIFSEEIRRLVASRESSESYLQVLFNKGRWDSSYPSGTSSLHISVLLGHEAVVELLLEKGADVDSKDDTGRTPLSWAAENGHEAVVKLLLEKGADVSSKDKYGQTPLSWAAENGLEMVMKLLLEKGADVDSKDKDGQTPLSWAAENGQEAVVKLLLEKGADVDSKGDTGRTPLSWAAEKGHEAVMKLLLEKGADVDSKDNTGRTPLSWAAENGHEAVMKPLLEKGADVDSRSNTGQTPLSWAAWNGHETVMKLLLDKGADVDSKDKYDQTPLLQAAQKGHETVMKLLLEKGADVDSKDNQYGQTPLSWAAENGHETVMKLLLDKGADVDSKSNDWSNAAVVGCVERTRDGDEIAA